MKARLLLITVSHPKNLEPSRRPQRAANCILALCGGDMRIGLPRRAHGEIAVDHRDVAEANPGAPSGFLRPRWSGRVAREDAVVIPFPARLLVDHDDRPHEFDLAEIDSLSAQGAEAITGPDLVGPDERGARAVG